MIPICQNELMKSFMGDSMSVLADSNVIIAFLVKSDKNNDKANELMISIIQERFGKLFTTDL